VTAVPPFQWLVCGRPKRRERVGFSKSGRQSGPDRAVSNDLLSGPLVRTVAAYEGVATVSPAGLLQAQNGAAGHEQTIRDQLSIRPVPSRLMRTSNAKNDHSDAAAVSFGHRLARAISCAARFVVLPMACVLGVACTTVVETRTYGPFRIGETKTEALEQAKARHVLGYSRDEWLLQRDEWIFFEPQTFFSPPQPHVEVTLYFEGDRIRRIRKIRHWDFPIDMP
jgi:hypothetical protein